ncbi:uncharacterized protein M421DRAFT_424851 [Didymella exigua CBS 183.55]|uniref:Uncharacterized protein n=1 Tax=Didymella exigua CBS 183.55 TaxID=1150837 RepID=A0A6A5RB17_9PLEO|nr:uncharacterized protein M421DRAFT_424851 [Didymella exigua CBS 183.55]KAF1924398.1 hypothetical protein M421DRAFT_424851 [Didymella exigua CBS 183.55]
MILRRTYVPSAALIRALARPQSPRCAFARPLPAQFVRGKKTKSQKAREAETARLAWNARKERRAEEAEEDEDRAEQQKAQDALEKMKKDPIHGATAKEVLKVMKLSQDPEAFEKIFEGGERPIFKDGEERYFEFFEEDPVTGERVKVDKLGSEADQVKEVETLEMIKKYMADPKYDAAELNKRMMDKLMADPAFADLTEDLKEIKEEILSKEEEKELEEQARKDAEPDIKEMGTQIRATIQEAIIKLYDDPDVGDAREDLGAVLRKLPEIEDLEDPELQRLLDRATESVNQNPILRAKLDASNELETEEEKQEWAAFEKEIDDLLEPDDPEDFPNLENPEEMNQLLVEMRELMKEIENSDELTKELDNGAELPTEEQAEQLAASVARFAELHGSSDPTSKSSITASTATDTATTANPDAEQEEHISPEMQAKVDKLMNDPRLLEKLTYIQKLMAEAAPPRDPNDLTQIDVELAPDPYEMEDSRTATLAQRMAIARADPEHRAALKALKVKLQPMYNISPALKGFNQAISFAYVGANDDVRRVLWRCYQKARRLPTFLQNLSDDAWDILYYSQAVTWAGNQNRTDHLKALLADLATVGKNGPPTHPSQLGQVQEAARLEAAQQEQREAKWRAGRMDAQV